MMNTTRNTTNYPTEKNTTSPLHTLEKQLARSKSQMKSSNLSQYQQQQQAPIENHDRESIYSFESVSTTGRLLDRLELDMDDLYDDSGDDSPGSFTTIPSTGRLFNRLSLNNGNNNNNSRLPSDTSLLIKTQIGPRSPIIRHPQAPFIQQPQRQQPHLKHVPMNLVFKNINTSIDVEADMASLKRVTTAGTVNTTIPLKEEDHQQQQQLPSSLDDGGSSASTPTSLTPSEKTLGSPMNTPSSPSPPTAANASHSPESSSKTRIKSEEQFIKPPPPLTIRSPSAPIVSTSEHNTHPENLRRFSADNDPPQQAQQQPNEEAQIIQEIIDSRLKFIQQLRSESNHREASYQLQRIANEPFYSTQAMYLYAKALKTGLGVKQNYKHALKWLCKCILITTITTSPTATLVVNSKLTNLDPEELVLFVIRHLENTNDEKDGYHNGTQPNQLELRFKKLSKPQIKEYVTLYRNTSDILAAAYHELGSFLINGWGIDVWKGVDEMNGIRCLQKLASMGYIGSMIQLGEVWGNKSKWHKKDLYKAARWLRMSEVFGVRLIGNSWIYKEKYLS